MIFETGLAASSFFSGQNSVIETSGKEPEPLLCLYFTYPTEQLRLDDVINIVDNTAVPPTEATGDRYILDNTGVTNPSWDGASANDIVEFDGASWVAETPSDGNYSLATTSPEQEYLFTTASGWNAGTPQPKIAYIYVNAPLPDPIPAGETHVSLGINGVVSWTNSNRDYDGYSVDIRGDNELDIENGFVRAYGNIKWFGSESANIIMESVEEGGGYFFTNDSGYFSFFNDITFTYSIDYEGSPVDGYYQVFGFGRSKDSSSFCRCNINIQSYVIIDSVDRNGEGQDCRFVIRGGGQFTQNKINVNVNMKAANGQGYDLDPYPQNGGQGGQSSFEMFKISTSTTTDFYGCTINRTVVLASGDGGSGGGDGSLERDGGNGGSSTGCSAYTGTAFLSNDEGRGSTTITINGGKGGDGGDGYSGAGTFYNYGGAGVGGNGLVSIATAKKESASITINTGEAGINGDSNADYGKGGAWTIGSDVFVTSESSQVSVNISSPSAGSGTSENGGGYGGRVTLTEIEAIEMPLPYVRTQDTEILLGVSIGGAGDGGNGIVINSPGGDGGNLDYTRTIDSVSGYTSSGAESVGDAGLGGTGDPDGDDGIRTVTTT